MTADLFAGYVGPQGDPQADHETCPYRAGLNGRALIAKGVNRLAAGTLMNIITTPPGRVVAAYIRQPLVIPNGRAAYVLELTFDPMAQCALRAVIVPAGQCQGPGHHRFCSARPPDLFDRYARPLVLATEIGAGSVVRVHGIAEIALLAMRAVQVLQLRSSVPFGRMDGSVLVTAEPNP
jgi:hypothetical protein